MAMTETRDEQPDPRRAEHYCLFDTAIGPSGIAWDAQGLTRFSLPQSDRAATERRVRAGKRSPAEPTAEVAAVIAELQRHFQGESTTFATVPLHLTPAEPFFRAIYDALRTVGWGRTVSYGELARLAGAPGEARTVGQAMARNPLPVIIPCHRVVTSDGKLGGFSAYGGALTKEKLLDLEGVYVGSQTPRLPDL